MLHSERVNWTDTNIQPPKCHFSLFAQNLCHFAEQFSTVKDFENFDAKNFIFSIFFTLSQVLPNDVKTVPRCFATLKATPKAPELILKPFEKKFPHRIFDYQKPFLLIGLTEPLKMPVYEGFQNLKAFSRWKLRPRYDRGSSFGS